MKKLSLNKTIQNDILNAIFEKKLQPGDKLPTEFELMEQYNVSRITVSNALSELAKKNIIIRYPRKGSFVNKELASPMPSNPTACISHQTIAVQDIQEKISIGFIIPSIRDLFALNIIHGISSCFYNDPLFYLNITYCCNQSCEEYIINDMVTKNMDGILLFPVDQEIYNEKILELKVNKFPFVLVDRYLPGIESHYVISDNIAGGQLATAHLCDLNHKNILVCCGAELDTFSIKERVQGYRNELYKRNIPIEEEAIIPNMLIRMNQKKAKKQIEDLLLDPKYTGIITTDSATALFLYDFFKQHGIRIPEDKSLISYDSPIANLFDFNPFTFIDQNEFTIGKEAGMIMKDLLLNKDQPHPFITKTIPPKLVINRTTAPAKSI